MGQGQSYTTHMDLSKPLSAQDVNANVAGCQASLVRSERHGVYELAESPLYRGMLVQTCGDGLTGPQKETCASRARYFYEGNFKCPHYQSMAFDPTSDINTLWDSMEMNTSGVPPACSKAAYQKAVLNQ